MAGTRTAPTINGTPTIKKLSLSWVDNSGDRRSFSMPIPTGTLDADIETLVAACQAASRASLFAVTVKEEYTSVYDKDNAEASVYEDVHDVFNFYLKDATGLTTFNFIAVPAPIYPDTFDANEEQPDPTDALVVAVTNALNTLWASVPVRTITFSKHTDRGKSVQA